MLVKRFFLIWISFLPFLLPAQNIQYAREIVDTLGSAYMAGRGYVDRGDFRAAKYIQTEFKRSKLEKFNGEFYQPFKIPMNTFPDEMEVKIDGTTLVPGSDYQVSANTKGLTGTFDLVWLTDTTLNLDQLAARIKTMDLKDKFLVTVKPVENIRNKEIRNVRGLILLQDKKLVWSVSNGNTVRDMVYLEMKKDKLPQGAKTISLNIKNEFYRKYKTGNVIGFVEGKMQPDTFIVFTAHYDHLGKMGAATWFPGANDNASGTAMLLDLARYYGHPAHQPKYSIAFMAFTGEEAGLLGSTYYVGHPLFPLNKIKFLINLDMVGTGLDGLKVVNGTIFEKAFNTLTTINQSKNYVKEIGKRGESAHSDHFPFYKSGVPSFFIYSLDGNYLDYHNVFDRPEKLPMTGYTGIFHLLTDFVSTF